MRQLFCDCKTDEEKANFFLSGRAVETGIIAPAISNDVAMAHHRCAEFQKEIDELRARIEAMEKQEPVGVLHVGSYYGEELQDWEFEADQRVCDRLNERHVTNPTSLNLYALPGAQPTPSVPDGWLRAIDEALVVAHLGVANAHDTYGQARTKLDNLINFHIDVATDPAVNGGWKLVPIEPTLEMLIAGAGSKYEKRGRNVWRDMLAAAPNERSESPEENHEIQKEARSYRSNAVVQEGRSPYGAHKR